MMRSVPFWVDNKSQFNSNSKKRMFLIFFPGTKNRFSLEPTTIWHLMSNLLKATAPRPLNGASRHCPKQLRFFLGPSGSLWTHWGLAYRSDETNNESSEATTKTHHRLGLTHLSLSVLSVVLHIRDVNQLHHGAGQRSTDVSWKKRHVCKLDQDKISSYC